MEPKVVHKLKLDDFFEGQKRAARMVLQGLLMQEEIKPDPTLVLSPEEEKRGKRTGSVSIRFLFENSRLGKYCISVMSCKITLHMVLYPCENVEKQK